MDTMIPQNCKGTIYKKSKEYKRPREKGGQDGGRDPKATPEVSGMEESK